MIRLFLFKPINFIVKTFFSDDYSFSFAEVSFIHL